MLSLLIRQGSRELKSSISLMQRRNFIFRKKTEKMYKKQDNVDPSYSIIYKAPMEYYLLSCNYVTSISAVVFGAYCVDRYIHRFEELSTEQVSLDYTGGLATMSDADTVYFAIGLLAMCTAIRLILHKYPLRIYKKDNNYIALFEGNLPMMRQKINFEKGAVKELAPTGIMPWKEHRYSINNRSSIIYFEYFKIPADFYDMMTPPKSVEQIEK